MLLGSETPDRGLLPVVTPGHAPEAQSSVSPALQRWEQEQNQPQSRRDGADSLFDSSATAPPNARSCCRPGQPGIPASHERTDPNEERSNRMADR